MKMYLEYVIPVIVMVNVKWSMGDAEPTTLLGLGSGALMQCDWGTGDAVPVECKPLSQQPGGVRSLVVAGEFLYLGLDSGELRRCHLTAPTDCTTFHTFLSAISDLAVAGKHIYAAWTDGVTKCGLRKSDDCTQFYLSESPVNSIDIFRRNLYIGMDDTFVSCSMTDPEDCTTSRNTTSAVSSLSAFGNSLYVALREGQVLTCELDDLTECTTLFETTSQIENLDIFNDHILTSLDTGDILRYVNDGSNESMIFKKNGEVALSLFTMFDTTNLKQHYVGENTDCSWQQWIGNCPPYIVYYDIESREQFELHVKDGKLYEITGKPMDTSEAQFSHSGRKAIFVMDPAGRIYASNTHPISLLHHSSLMAGKPVAAAGELTIEKGIIKMVSTCSGHYRPRFALGKQILISLRKQGYTRPVNVKDCFGMQLMIDLDYKKTDLYYKAKYNEYLRKLKGLKLKH